MFLGPRRDYCSIFNQGKGVGRGVEWGFGSLTGGPRGSGWELWGCGGGLRWCSAPLPAPRQVQRSRRRTLEVGDQYYLYPSGVPHPLVPSLGVRWGDVLCEVDFLFLPTGVRKVREDRTDDWVLRCR